MGTIALAIINVPMTALGVFLMDKSGRRPLLLVRWLRRPLQVFLSFILNLL